MTGKQTDLTAWPSVPADRDLPPGHHGLHRAKLMNDIRDRRPPASARPRTPGPRRRSPRRRLAAAVACFAVAGGIAGYAISAGGAAPAPPALRHPHPAVGKPATLAARVLRDAASHVARATLTAEASPGQWIYTKTVVAGNDDRNATAVDNWVTFDGRQSAYYSAGQLVVHTSDPNPPGAGVPPWRAWNEAVSGMTACNVLASLPAGSQQLLAVIAAHMGPISEMGGDNILPFSPAPVTRAQAEFVYLTHIMWNTFLGAGCPPAVLGPAYRSLATLPGISVQTGITDAVGAPAIGISDDGGYSQLLLSPTSYQVIGARLISPGFNPLIQRLDERIAKLPKARRAVALERLRERDGLAIPWPPKGEVVSSTALVQAAEVAAPGDV